VLHLYRKYGWTKQQSPTAEDDLSIEEANPTLHNIPYNTQIHMKTSQNTKKKHRPKAQERREASKWQENQERQENQGRQDDGPPLAALY
jgi:hypothetical protein